MAKKPPSLKVQLKAARSRIGRDARTIGKLRKELALFEESRGLLVSRANQRENLIENQQAVLARREEEILDLRRRLGACEKAHVRRSEEIQRLQSSIIKKEGCITRLAALNAEQEALIDHLEQKLKGEEELADHLRAVAVLIGRTYTRADFTQMGAAGFFQFLWEIEAPPPVTETALATLTEAIISEGINR